MAISALEKSGTLSPMSKDQWGEGSIYLRGRRWWISYPFNGQQIKESSKSQDVEVAKKLLKKRRRQILKDEFGGIEAERILVDEILDDLIQDYEINGKSVAWARIVVNVHLRPFFGYYRASQVKSALIDKYVASRRAKGIKNSTVNRELALLRSAYRKASRKDPPKVAHVPFIPKLKENNVRKGFFEADDFKALYRKLPVDVQPVALFAYYTGCRRSEILRLGWTQFDKAAHTIRLEPGETKNDDARTIPLADELYERIVALKAERDADWPRCPYIFTRQGTPIKDFRAAWDSAAEKAGLDDRLFHDLRRTGVRNLVRAGVPEVVAMAISGHRTRSVFERYNIVSGADLKEAAGKLQKHIGRIG